jgi:hypothetical protein
MSGISLLYVGSHAQKIFLTSRGLVGGARVTCSSGSHLLQTHEALSMSFTVAVATLYRLGPDDACELLLFVAGRLPRRLHVPLACHVSLERACAQTED